METNGNIKAIIREVLGSRPHRRIKDLDESYSRASVLIPLWVEQGQIFVLFTQRTQRVEHHKGQISFPGGRVERQDRSTEETALRETQEEIGIGPRDVEILGRIDDTLTLASRFVVHPFVGVIPHPYEFRLNREEVERVIKVPASVFYPADWKDHRGMIEYEGMTYPSLVYSFDGDVIWGATARMMQNFMEIMDGRLPLSVKEK
jgi:8-oxo-dGTP pyrophosphatase MutT (NUDIX family)